MDAVKFGCGRATAQAYIDHNKERFVATTAEATRHDNCILHAMTSAHHLCHPNTYTPCRAPHTKIVRHVAGGDPIARHAAAAAAAVTIAATAASRSLSRWRDGIRLVKQSRLPHFHMECGFRRPNSASIPSTSDGTHAHADGKEKHHQQSHVCVIGRRRTLSQSRGQNLAGGVREVAELPKPPRPQSVAIHKAGERAALAAATAWGCRECTYGRAADSCGACVDDAPHHAPCASQSPATQRRVWPTLCMGSKTVGAVGASTQHRAIRVLVACVDAEPPYLPRPSRLAPFRRCPRTAHKTSTNFGDLSSIEGGGDGVTPCISRSGGMLCGCTKGSGVRQNSWSVQHLISPQPRWVSKSVMAAR